jgi:hypothetical protein
MTCEACYARMIMRYVSRPVQTPPEYPWYWWCACGNTEPGNTEPGRVDNEEALRRWRAENRNR